MGAYMDRRQQNFKEPRDSWAKVWSELEIRMAAETRMRLTEMEVHLTDQVGALKCPFAKHF
jgi:hypothetical protein